MAQLHYKSKVAPSDEKKEKISKEGKSEFNVSIFIGKIQLGLAALSMIIVPTIVIPIPWAWAEYGKSMALIGFAIAIFTLEAIKLFMSGKFSIAKSKLDIGIVAIALSIFLSTLFSGDLNISMYGYEFRWGPGFIALITVFSYFYIFRSYIKSARALFFALDIALLGVTISAILSSMSFFGVNLMNFGSFKNLFFPGISVFASPRTALIIFGVGLSLGFMQIFISAYRKSTASFIIGVVSTIINALAISLFSIKQGSPIVIAFIVLLVASVAMVLSLKDAEFKKKVSIIGISLAIVLISFGVLKISALNKALPNSKNIATHVSLGTAASWKVSTSVLGDSVSHGVFGLGNDTYSIAFNRFKPATSNGVDLSSADFTYGSSEVMTIIGNRGVIGLITWFVLGYFIITTLIKDFRTGSVQKEFKVITIFTGTAMLFIFVSSFLSYFTFPVYFMIFALASLNIIARNLGDIKTASTLSFDFTAKSENEGQKVKFLPLLLSLVAIITGAFFGGLFVREAIGTHYIVKSEGVIADINKDLANSVRNDGDDVTLKDQRAAVVSSINYYAKALKYQPNNYVVHRLVGLRSLEYVKSLAIEYANTEDQGEKDKITAKVGDAIDLSINETKEATDISPNVYTNWGARATVYSDLVDLGFKSYTKSAVTTYAAATELNPRFYFLYYQTAVLLNKDAEYDSAMKYVNKSLGLNPNHVPSRVLLANLYIREKKYDDAKKQLETTQKIIKKTGQEDSKLYKSVGELIKRIEEVQAQEQ